MRVFRAVVTEGRGEARAFTQLDWVCRQFRDKFGFDPHPGTLNLQVDRNAIAWGKVCRGTTIEPGAPGFCAAKALRVRVNDRLAAVWIIPEVPDYPANQVELMADQSLRDALDLRNGDTVSIQVVDGE